MTVYHREQLILSGEIITGVGKGGNYLQMAEFVHQFEPILGSKPYPGTLNIRVRKMRPTDFEMLDELKKGEGIPIQGFSRDGKDYLPGISLKCTLSVGHTDHSALVFFPERTVHSPEVLEVITRQRILDISMIGDKAIVWL